jgi:cytochrome P450
VILVSPASNVMYTCDPEIISQITSRRYDFPKPMSLLRMLNIYGPTLSGSEGAEARSYRKVTTPSFNERSHRKVWDELLEQTQSMLESWDKLGGRITNLSEDMGKLALHVISKVFFDKKMEWKDDQNKRDVLPAGHSLTYTQAINAAAENNSTLFLTPKSILSR